MDTQDTDRPGTPPQAVPEAPPEAARPEPPPPAPMPELTDGVGATDGTARTARPRGRTALIIGGAVVLGLLAGTVTGYAVQYDRAPTPLPPLSQPELRTPKDVAAGPGADPQAVNVHRRVPTDGDLRKLLLKKPKGARDNERVQQGWRELPDFATEYKRPDRMFVYAAGEIRRIATAGWEEDGEVFVTVNLIQFHDKTSTFAAQWTEDQQGYMPREAGNDGVPVPGSDNGRVYVFDEPLRKAGYEPVYRARAVAHRGDVAVEIRYMNNTRPVSSKSLMALIKKQLERL
ncbi:hypothetical protein [Streptomyces sp. NPDC059828]|uniref:hypothetical protein n=1 Tax=Streptomyces sp. NPDC059828 TaxID=3346965 RepID=UPI003656E384